MTTTSNVVRIHVLSTAVRQRTIPPYCAYAGGRLTIPAYSMRPAACHQDTTGDLNHCRCGVDAIHETLLTSPWVAQHPARTQTSKPPELGDLPTYTQSDSRTRANAGSVSARRMGVGSGFLFDRGCKRRFDFQRILA